MFQIEIFCCFRFIYDRSTPCKGSRPMKFFRSLFVWKYMKRYFPMRIVKTAELPADRNYIVAAHPHGILSFGTFLTFCTEAPGFSELFPGLQRRYAVTLPIQYWFPIRRELLMLTSKFKTVNYKLPLFRYNFFGSISNWTRFGRTRMRDGSWNCTRWSWWGAQLISRQL